MMDQATNAVAQAATAVDTSLKSPKDATTRRAAKCRHTMNKTAAAATTTTASTAQGFIDQAKAYVRDKKYQPALDSLQKLTSFKLTDAQQNMVND